MHTGKFRIFVMIRLVASISKLGKRSRSVRFSCDREKVMNTSHHDREFWKRYFKPCISFLVHWNIRTVLLIPRDIAYRYIPYKFTSIAKHRKTQNKKSNIYLWRNISITSTSLHWNNNREQIVTVIQLILLLNKAFSANCRLFQKCLRKLKYIKI